MDFAKYGPKLKHIRLFHDLTDDQLKHLISDVREISLAKGDYLIKEGDFGTDFFFIEEGEVEILKKNPMNGEQVAISVQGKGKIVGEMALIKEDRREASIIALKPTLVLAISIRKRDMDPVYHHIKARISDFLTLRIKEGNNIVIDKVSANLEHTKARAGLGNLIIHLLAAIFLYIFAIRSLAVLQVNVISSSAISLPILSLFAISMLILIKTNDYPLSLYGFTWEGGKQAAVESILFSIPLFGIILLAKWGVIYFIPEFHDLKFFHVSPALENGIAPPSSMTFIILVCLYALFVPIQEFIFRGAIQSSLQQFLLGKHKTLQAILISNLPFSMIHLHLSLSLTIFVYIIGVFWGWMYARQGTLIGCSISHFLIGLWAFFIVGIQDFLIV